MKALAAYNSDQITYWVLQYHT